MTRTNITTCDIVNRHVSEFESQQIVYKMEPMGELAKYPFADQGRRLRWLRQAERITTAHAFAKYVGWPQSGMSQFETGMRRVPLDKALQLKQRIPGFDPLWLWEGNKDGLSFHAYPVDTHTYPCFPFIGRSRPLMERKMKMPRKTPRAALVEIKFATGPDSETISKIVDRAWNIDWLRRSYESRMDMQMDVSAVHANGNPLRLKDLLGADDFNFTHDMSGICNCLDRNTGKLTRGFSPRLSG